MEILQRIKNRINRNPYYLDFKHELEKPLVIGRRCALLYYYLDFKRTLNSIYYRNDFKDIRTIVLTIGFNRSGSSLLGYLLTAHPNIIIADEVSHQIVAQIKFSFVDGGMDYLRRRYEGPLSILFSEILRTDQLRYQHYNSILSLHNEAQQEIYKRSEDRSERYIRVPNQYQGRFERLKIVGVKNSYENTFVLLRNNTLVNLRRHCKERDIKLKFLFTIRNPYDLISRMFIVNLFTEEKAVKIFKDRCKRLEELLKRIDSQDIFLNRHEDICKDPRRQLARLCDFLQVPIPAGYTEDCASQVVQEPYKSRLDIDWSPQLKQTVAAMIEKYDFLLGYDWET